MIGGSLRRLPEIAFPIISARSTAPPINVLRLAVSFRNNQTQKGALLKPIALKFYLERQMAKACINI
jgi:hypothetical protein